MSISLNERQKEAAEHKDGPLLVLAGAGAGKTKTIVERIRRLIASGIAPENILAITFTNKAAGEMKERVGKLLAEDPALNRPISFAERPFVSTFHSLGVHIIKENCRTLGVPRHFSIFDKGDSRRAVKEAMENSGFEPKEFDPGLIQNIISKEKGDFITLEMYAETADGDYMREVVAKTWTAYENILRREKALDFDDLLLRTATLLETNHQVLEHYQNIWRYIHVDEYQDTNKVQYEITRLLAERDKNICVVGDIDQNIYSWRGASLRNILNFEKDYPKAKVVVLEENYRSTQTILNAANSIIEKNTYRKEKRLFTKNPTGEKIALYGAYDEADEADFVTNTAAKLIDGKVRPEEIAVLFRANFQSRALEESFLAKDIGYQLLGVRFFERKEIKDALSFVRAALNPESFGDIKRIVNVPPRGIGKITLLKMFSGQERELAGKVGERVKEFRALLTKIRETALKAKPSETLKFVIKAGGMERMYDTKNDEDLERLENLKELVTLATKYDIHNDETGIEKLLSDAALASDQDTLREDGKGVKLMTAHASKGLEFDYVYITGLEEGLFPHSRASEKLENTEDAEEERRLFYVALTRARKKVFLSHAATRTIFGARQVNIPSEFVYDIPPEFIEEADGNSRRRKPLLTIAF